LTSSFEDRTPQQGSRAPESDAPSPAQQLGGYLRALRRRWPLIVGITILVTAVAVVLSASKTKQYDASADVLLTEDEPITAFINPNAQSRPSDPEREVNTKIALIRLDTVANEVDRKLNLPGTGDDLLKSVRTELNGNSNLVSIVARDPNPTRARDEANAFADTYQSFRRKSAQSALNDAARLAQTRLAELTPADRATPEGRQLSAQLQQLEIAAAGQTGGIEVVRHADTPTSIATPHPMKTGVIAFVLGLLLATGLTLLLELLDRRLRDEEEVESFFELPVLATVPRPRRRFQGAKPGDDPGQHESYAALATNLRFFELGPEVSTVMVTSPSPGEGKTSVALGTARALSTLGQRVLCIEADMRRPTFRNYGLQQGERGLSTVLAGRSKLQESIVRVSAETFEPVSAGAESGPSFWVLPCGPVPPNPQGLLSRRTVGALLEQARQAADVVIIDVPPVGTVNDPVTLANYVDGIVLIARLNKTTRDSARKTLRVLRNLQAPLLGVVMTDAPITGEGYYGEPVYAAVSAQEAAAGDGVRA
jgi:succinoglycan biosynthesis transport protein ExoP